MGTSPEPAPARPAARDPALEPWIGWLHAHAKEQPGWVQGWEWLACVTPGLPGKPFPRWLLGELFPDQELILRRIELYRRPIPGFQVLTSSGREVGVIIGTTAAMIEHALSEGITPRVSVGVVSSSAAPAWALRLALDVMVWSAPGDLRGTLRSTVRRQRPRDRATARAGNATPG